MKNVRRLISKTDQFITQQEKSAESGKYFQLRYEICPESIKMEIGEQKRTKQIIKHPAGHFFLSEISSSHLSYQTRMAGPKKGTKKRNKFLKLVFQHLKTLLQKNLSSDPQRVILTFSGRTQKRRLTWKQIPSRKLSSPPLSTSVSWKKRRSAKVTWFLSLALLLYLCMCFQIFTCQQKVLTNNKLSYFFGYAVKDGDSNTQIITNGCFQVRVLYDEFFEQNEKGEISKEKFLEEREVQIKIRIILKK